jgi:hypothetical protein
MCSLRRILGKSEYHNYLIGLEVLNEGLFLGALRAHKGGISIPGKLIV